MKRIGVGLFVTIFTFIIVWTVSAMPAYRDDTLPPDKDIVALSGQLLLAVKMEIPTDTIENALATLSKQRLITALSNDTARKVFWINIYNAYYQLLATREHKTKPDIFTDKAINIGGMKLSLDDVEHGILRRYRWKWSAGYLPSFWPATHIKKLAVTHIDYRIHFALNCGAKSCPPIAFYDYDQLEAQLKLAATSFLSQDVEVDTAAKTVSLSKLMQWFKGDFGGQQGIKTMLQKYLGKDFSKYRIEYKEYDWSPALGNWN